MQQKLSRCFWLLTIKKSKWISALLQWSYAAFLITGKFKIKVLEPLMRGGSEIIREKINQHIFLLPVWQTTSVKNKIACSFCLISPGSSGSRRASRGSDHEHKIIGLKFREKWVRVSVHLFRAKCSEWGDFLKNCSQCNLESGCTLGETCSNS